MVARSSVLNAQRSCHRCDLYRNVAIVSIVSSDPILPFYFDVIKDGSAGLGAGGEAMMIDQFVFEAAKERLDEGVIVAVGFAAHGRDQAVLG